MREKICKFFRVIRDNAIHIAIIIFFFSFVITSYGYFNMRSMNEHIEKSEERITEIERQMKLSGKPVDQTVCSGSCEPAGIHRDPTAINGNNSRLHKGHCTLRKPSVIILSIQKTKQAIGKVEVERKFSQVLSSADAWENQKGRGEVKWSLSH